jgi:hypothetical protein
MLVLGMITETIMEPNKIQVIDASSGSHAKQKKKQSDDIYMHQSFTVFTSVVDGVCFANKFQRH